MTFEIECPRCGERLQIIPRDEEEALLLLYLVLDQNSRNHLLHYAESLAILVEAHRREQKGG